MTDSTEERKKSFDWTLGIAGLFDKDDGRDEEIILRDGPRYTNGSDAASLASDATEEMTAEEKEDMKRTAEVPRGFRRARVFWFNVLGAIMKYNLCTKWNSVFFDENKMKKKESELHKKLAQQLLEVILELRGSYVKVGQQLAVAQVWLFERSENNII
jgi:hypothetical protein